MILESRVAIYIVIILEKVQLSNKIKFGKKSNAMKILQNLYIMGAAEL